MTPLERRYRPWLLAYPEEYRRENETELLDTLVQAAAPGQAWPSAREVAALVAGGLRARARLAAATPGRVWADGLRWGAIAVLGVSCATTIDTSLYGFLLPLLHMGSLGHPELVHLEVVALAIAFVALAAARYEIGLIAIAAEVAVQAVMRGTVPLPVGPLEAVPIPWLLPAGIVAALAWHPGLRPFRRPWSPRLILLALAGVGLLSTCLLALGALGQFSARAMSALFSVLIVVQPTVVVPAGLLLALALVGHDQRHAWAATVFVAVAVVTTAQVLVAYPTLPGSSIAYVHGQLLVSVAVAAVALAVTALSARRRIMI